MIKGKMAYMPPEQLAREPRDRRADLFALGIVFYELITGGMPFDATSEVSIIQAIMSQKPLEKATVYRPDCPPELEAIVDKCLEKDRTKRYASCVELQADLETFIRNSGQSVGTREISQLVETVFENEADTTLPHAVVSNSALNDPAIGLEHTLPGKSAEIPKPPPSAPRPPNLGTGMSNTALRSVETNAVKRSKAPIFVGLGVMLLVGVALAYFATRPPVEVPKDPVKPIAVAVVDSGVAPEAVDAGVAVAIAEVDAGTEETPVDAGVAVAAVEPPKPVAPKNGKLEFRIRPYATIYLDDRKLGDTPLPAMSVPVGKHKIRLVNASLGKDVELNVVIKPGENVVKHNLKE
jgi:serine/threonine-protein kinase